MRYTIKILKSHLANADVEYIALAADSLIPRFRDKIVSDGALAVALARIAAQLVYRVASDRIREQGELVRFQIELADWEREALIKHKKDIIRELTDMIEYYKEIYDRAKCKKCVAGRIAALEVMKTVIAQIAVKKKRDSKAELSLDSE